MRQKRVETEGRVLAELAIPQSAQRNATCCGPCKVEETKLDDCGQKFSMLVVAAKAFTFVLHSAGTRPNARLTSPGRK